MQTTAAPNNLAHRLQLYLLGTPRVIRDAEPVTAFRTSKSQGLLYYLAVTGSVQQRSTLFALLWPEYHDKRAGASLRTTLSNLRKLIGDHLVTTRQTVHLHREGLWLDAAHFDALLRRTGDRVADVVLMQA
ncbi:MAG: hypothetical protein ACK2U9_05235, partial [Anaerolineae bacterium]